MAATSTAVDSALPSVLAKRLKAVFFDLDDTLVLTTDADVRSHTAVEQLIACSAPQVDTARLLSDWKGLFKKDPWDVTHQVPVEEWRAGLWLKALQLQGVDEEVLAQRAQKCFRDTRLEHFKVEPDVRELLVSLKARGIKAVIITNGHHEVQHSKLAACGVGDLVDAVIVGGDEALHVGDSLSADIQGATNAGLAATIWVNRSGQEVPEGNPAPTVSVRHVRDVEELLQSVL